MLDINLFSFRVNTTEPMTQLTEQLGYSISRRSDSEPNSETHSSRNLTYTKKKEGIRYG